MTAPTMTSTSPRPAWPARQARQFTRICAYCGQPFPTSSDRARFCTQAHRQAAYRDRRDRQKGGNDGQDN